MKAETEDINKEHCAVAKNHDTKNDDGIESSNNVLHPVGDFSWYAEGSTLTHQL